MTPVDKNSDPLDAILRRTMRAEPGAATPECADAESLAAYSDRSIAAAERARLEAHFADCMHCQVLLADIARADESARVANLASAVPWYRKWRIAIPAMAAVAAVAALVAIRRPANEETPSDQLVAMSQPQAPPINPGAQQPAPAPAAPAAASASAPAAPPSNEIALNEAKPAAAPRAEAMSAPASASRAVAAPPRVNFNGRAFGAFGAVGRLAAPAPVTGAVGLGGGGAGAAVAMADSAQNSAVLISTPDQSAAWIAGKNGMIQRRAADGSWQILHSGVSTDLVAGAAPSASVCWIVGRSGTIVRTTDGERWTLIAAPSADNLTSVSASNARDATITTAGGQSFATADGGASWHRQ